MATGKGRDIIFAQSSPSQGRGGDVSNILQSTHVQVGKVLFFLRIFLIDLMKWKKICSNLPWYRIVLQKVEYGALFGISSKTSGNYSVSEEIIKCFHQWSAFRSLENISTAYQISEHLPYFSLSIPSPTFNTSEEVSLFQVKMLKDSHKERTNI